jgi:hypothetical protein
VAVVTSRRRLSIIATAPFATEIVSGGRARLVPASPVHAKVFGTISTLCGRSTLTWAKFWDLPFLGMKDDRCPDCWEILRNGGTVARRR